MCLGAQYFCLFVQTIQGKRELFVGKLVCCSASPRVKNACWFFFFISLQCLRSARAHRCRFYNETTHRPTAVSVVVTGDRFFERGRSEFSAVGRCTVDGGGGAAAVFVAESSVVFSYSNQLSIITIIIIILCYLDYYYIYCSLSGQKKKKKPK